MRLIGFFCSLFLVATSLYAQRSLDLSKSGILSLEYSIDFEVLEWSDSTEYQFLVITVKQPYEIDSVNLSLDIPISEDHYYSNLYQFYVDQDDCHFYPIRFIMGSMMDTVNNLHYNTMKGLYLVNDFKRNLDSLELVLVTHSGYWLQSQMYTLNHLVEVDYCPQKEIETKNLLATKKRYKTWSNTESKTYNPRLYHMEYSGCKD